MVPLSAAQLSDSIASGGHSCERGQIDLWLLSASIDAEQRAFYDAVLSVEERERARRFRFKRDQDRSTVGRGGLRWILSRYCVSDPTNLLFRLGSHGKPSLISTSSPIEFSVSHAGECVLIAITRDAECGVDIERSHARISDQDIADQFFCPREIEWMKHVESGFLRLWTMKEALVKALGCGLSIPLNAIDVVDIAEGTTSTFGLQMVALKPQTLWLRELELLEGYAASVAAIGVDFNIRIVTDRI